MAALNGIKEIVGSVVDAWNNVGITLSVGCPQDDHFVEAIRFLEGAIICNVLVTNASDKRHRFYNLPNITTNLFQVLGLATFEKIVGTIFLIGSDKVRVIDAR